MGALGGIGPRKRVCPMSVMPNRKKARKRPGRMNANWDALFILHYSYMRDESFPPELRSNVAFCRRYLSGR